MNFEINKLKRKLVLVAVVMVMVVSSTMMASAHFQLIMPTDDVLSSQDEKEIDLDLIFTHPGEASHTMEMGEPVQFGVYHKGRKKDLLDSLEKTTFDGATAYETSYQTRGFGDFVFYLQPAPYWEEMDGLYISQYTKVVVNSMGAPSDWDAELGLKAEIVPLTRPYGLWAGNVFQGVVKKDGQPVPHAEIEVERLNAESYSGINNAEFEFPTPAHATQVIKADENGVFTYGIPNSGWWGFAALMEGEQINGKDHEIGAVMWVKAHAID